MRASNSKSIYTLCAITILFLVGSASGSDNSSSESMLPEGLIVENIYKPGLGAPVGKVGLVQGKVVIIHRDILRGYWAKNGLPLYQGDTIITEEKGRMTFKLNDGSSLTLASGTKLAVTRSVYDPTKKSRSSFLRMTVGKARFWVVKLMGFTRSEFKVKTKTAVMGVRGSDFIVRATPNLTEVTALAETRLEIVSLAAPEVKPTLLADFERATVEEGALPSEVEKISPEEIEQIKKGFMDTPERIGPEAQVEGWTATGKAEKKEDSSEKGEDTGEAEDKVGEEGKKGEVRPTEEGPTEEVTSEEEGGTEQTPILVPTDELVVPEGLGESEVFADPLTPNIFDEQEISNQEEQVTQQQEAILEEQSEDAVTQTPTQLPGFPGTPQ